MTPDKPVAIEAWSGRSRNYAELESRANRIARMLRANGLTMGTTIAWLMHDSLEVFDIAWAAQRSGLHYLPVYWNLDAADAAWMIDHADARVLFFGAAFADMAVAISRRLPGLLLICVDGGAPDALDARIAALTDHPIADEARGMALQYTGGTTGRPKGVRRGIDGAPIDTPDILMPFALERFGFTQDMRLSTTAPMYHVAPLKLSMIAHALGGTTILMGDFNPENALAAIERFAVTHCHWVPHMLVAMAKLPESERNRHNLSSLRCAIHAAAPCPPSVKRKMIDWWGPIVHEIYAGTEGIGFCMIGPEEWLRKPGSVGRSVIGKVRILMPDGTIAQPGEVGEVWFEDALPFAYHKDAARTAAAINAAGWVTMDDLGYLDQDGYLFLRDRKTTMLSVSGTAIYPRVVEDSLIDDPAISDIAVALVVDSEGRDVLVAGYAPIHHVHDRARLAQCLAQRAAILPPSARPVSYHQLIPFPRDADGKIDRVSLAHLLAERARLLPAHPKDSR